ncbi:unnamed protein product [Cyprideis torosa]|uniref:glutaminyl-peptide cyclotransferase n=1 Tax=Cyprideis torosa TaxID=163714 RepID=A0A7R8ZPR4_9CRUS|nr:unnamed protein product [Cyprideis torosa]CAG0894606.1 unnamed protein product [Cyprideis torosa]
MPAERMDNGTFSLLMSTLLWALVFQRAETQGMTLLDLIVTVNQWVKDPYLHDLAYEIGRTSRVIGSKRHAEVRKYIVDEMGKAGFKVTVESHNEPVPQHSELGHKTQIQFHNIIGDSDPTGLKQTIVLACHYDSKVFINKPRFTGAMDSAVPCAMQLFIGRKLLPLIANSRLALKLIFFDGEEAIKDWTDTDSLYGSRYMANLWGNKPHSSDPSKTKNDQIDLFILLDLIGAFMGCSGKTSFHDVKRSTEHHSQALADMEKLWIAQNLLDGKNRCRCPTCPVYFIPTGDQAIDDDHKPFQKRGVPILHLIGTPFPPNWHTDFDNIDYINMDDVKNIVRILTTYLAQQFLKETL